VSNLYSNVLTGDASNGERYVVSIEDKQNNHGFNFGLGFSFSKDSLGRRKDRRLSVGAVYNFASDLKSKSHSKIFRTLLSGDTVERYTIERKEGELHLPQGFSAGISYGKGVNWSFGTEFAYQDWANFKSTRSGRRGIGKSWRTSVGGEFTMDPLALESYLKRVTFRAGLTYEQYPFLANGNAVKDYGINFGFSLPAGRSSMDLALKVGKRGNKAENVLEESYFKIFFGITFNDQWFIKRKFD
jgi:long-subunit fatty acid transport protein